MCPGCGAARAHIERMHRPPKFGVMWDALSIEQLRVIARKNGNRVRLYSRPGNDLTPRLLSTLLRGCAPGPASSMAKPSPACPIGTFGTFSGDFRTDVDVVKAGLNLKFSAYTGWR